MKQKEYPMKQRKKDKYKYGQCEFQTEYKANLQRHIEKQHKK